MRKKKDNEKSKCNIFLTISQMYHHAPKLEKLDYPRLDPKARSIFFLGP